MSGNLKHRIALQFAEGFQVQGNTPVQEDYFEINPDRGIFILADGFGGAVGQRAAEIVVKSIRQYLEQEAGDLDATMPFELRPYYSLAGNVLFNAVSFANQKLIEMNRGRSWEDSGGASLIAGYIEGKLLSVAQVGACRLRLKRGAQLKEVVVSKSLLRQIDPISEEGPGDGIPLMSFGTAKSLEPEITEIELRSGDQVFFETSGVRRAMVDAILSLNGPHGLSQLLDSVQSDGNASIIWLGF